MAAGGVLAAPPFPARRARPRPLGRAAARLAARGLPPRSRWTRWSTSWPTSPAGPGRRPRHERVPDGLARCWRPPWWWPAGCACRAAPHRAAGGRRRRAPLRRPLAGAARFRGAGRRDPGLGGFGAMPIAVTAFAVEHGAAGAAAAPFLVSSSPACWPACCTGQRQVAHACAGAAGGGHDRARGRLPALLWPDRRSNWRLRRAYRARGPPGLCPVLGACRIGSPPGRVHPGVCGPSSASAAGSAPSAAAAWRGGGHLRRARRLRGGRSPRGVMALPAVTGSAVLRVPPRHEPRAAPDAAKPVTQRSSGAASPGRGRPRCARCGRR